MRDYAALSARLQRIARRLPEAMLTGAADHDLEHDLLMGLGAREDDRLLGYYTQAGIHSALEAYGIFDELRHRGYGAFEVRFDLQPFAHTLRLLADGLLVCECRVRQARGASDPCIAAFQRDFLPELLDVEWLALSDPRADFSPERPPLPGQDAPGSGVGGEVFVLLLIMARRLGLHGVVEVPERFHNALFYRQARFIDPVFQGQFEALSELAAHHPLGDVAWALETGRVINAADDTPIQWAPREQLHALDPRLIEYFELPAWRRARGSASPA